MTRKPLPTDTARLPVRRRRQLHGVFVRRREAGAVAAIGASLALLACSIQPPGFSDMVDTPARHADEGLLSPPEGSLHTDGEVKTSRFEAAFTLSNPLPSSQRVLQQGARLFAIYCQPCHGSRGLADGPVAGYFGRPPLDLTSARAKGQTDGYVYATIRDGGGTMPAYGDALDVDERWAIIHYVRSLQQ